MRKVSKDFNAPPAALQIGFEKKKTDLLERKSDHQFDKGGKMNYNSFFIILIKEYFGQLL